MAVRVVGREERAGCVLCVCKSNRAGKRGEKGHEGDRLGWTRPYVHTCTYTNPNKIPSHVGRVRETDSGGIELPGVFYVSLA